MIAWMHMSALIQALIGMYSLTICSIPDIHFKQSYIYRVMELFNNENDVLFKIQY